MDLLITVSNSESSDILTGLLQACSRRGCSWQVFMTHEGVKVLHNPNVSDVLESNKDQVVVCHDSWQRYGNRNACPVTVGSQTNHSEMAARAMRVVSL